MLRVFRQVFRFYKAGFQSMTIGKNLWLIILVKLFIIFVLLKWIFFPDLLKTRFRTDRERSNHVIHELTK